MSPGASSARPRPRRQRGREPVEAGRKRAPRGGHAARAQEPGDQEMDRRGDGRGRRRGGAPPPLPEAPWLAAPPRARSRNTSSPAPAPPAAPRAVARSLQQASTAAGASADAARPSVARRSVQAPDGNQARQRAGARDESDREAPRPPGGHLAPPARESAEAPQRGRRAPDRETAEEEPGQHGSRCSRPRHARGQRVDLGPGDAAHVDLGGQPGRVEAPPHRERHAPRSPGSRPAGRRAPATAGPRPRESRRSAGRARRESPSRPGP